MNTRSLGQAKYADGRGPWLFKRDKVLGQLILRLVVHRKRSDMGWGNWPEVSIPETRDPATKARRQLREGIDPIIEWKKIKLGTKPLTLAEAISGCFEAKEAELKRDRKAGKWMPRLNVQVIPKIGNYPV